MGAEDRTSVGAEVGEENPTKPLCEAENAGQYADRDQLREPLDGGDTEAELDLVVGVHPSEGCRVMRIRTEQPPPRGFTPAEVTARLAAIPTSHVRDRVLFGLLATTGLRVGEALSLHVDDLQLARGDERLSVRGKGGRHRTVLLDYPALLRLLRRYLREVRYQHGPLFRAERGTSSSALRYQSVQARFGSYATAAGIAGSLHDLRHAHAQALVQGGVSLATIRKRLGHANINTTRRYAEQSDTAADAELRQWRRTGPSARLGNPGRAASP